MLRPSRARMARRLPALLLTVAVAGAVAAACGAPPGGPPLIRAPDPGAAAASSPSPGPQGEPPRGSEPSPVPNPTAKPAAILPPEGAFGLTLSSPQAAASPAPAAAAPASGPQPERSREPGASPAPPASPAPQATAGPAAHLPPNGPFGLTLASPQAAGLAAWWPTRNLTEGGPLPDYAGNNHGALQGRVEMAEDPVLGRMLRFDGDERNYYRVPGAPAIDQTGDFTVSFWWRVPALEGGVPIGLLAKGTNFPYSRAQFYAFKPALGPMTQLLDFNVGDGTDTYWPTESGPLTGGALLHIAFVRSGGTMLQYMNGAPQYTNFGRAWPAPPGPLHISPDPLLIGRLAGQGAPARGDLGDIRIYGRALTAAEVAALWDPATRFDLYGPPPTP